MPDITPVEENLGQSLRNDLLTKEQRENPDWKIPTHDFDELTKLPNRAAFERDLSNLKDVNIGLLIIDVDDFKIVNDTKGGHSAGDKTLKWIAFTLESNLRSNGRGVDKVYRIGGDEFGVIVSNIEDGGQLFQVAERLRQTVNDNPIPGLQDKEYRQGLSIGGVAFEAGSDNLSRMDEADNALYQAKEQGKNQTKIYENV